MLDRLNTFDNKLTTLGDLIASLNGLLNAVTDIDQGWKTAFQKQWAMLEEVYADALDKDLREISAENLGLVNRAIEEIRRLVTQRI